MDFCKPLNAQRLKYIISLNRQQQLQEIYCITYISHIGISCRYLSPEINCFMRECVSANNLKKKKIKETSFFFFAFNRIQPQTLNPNTCVIYQFCTEIILLKLNMIFRFLLQYIYASEFILDLYRHCSLIDQCAARCALIQVRGSPLDFRKVHSKFQHSQVNKMSTKLA